MKQIISSVALASFLFCLPAGAQEAAKQWSLEECIRYAIENNIDLKQKELEQKSREVDLHTSKYSWLPSVNASVGENFGFGRSESKDGLIVDRNSANTSAGIQLSMPIFDGLKIPNDIAARKLDLKASIETLNKAKEDLSINVASYYLQVLYNKEMLKIAQLQVDLSSEQVTKTEALYNAGKIPVSQLYDMKAQLAKDEVTLTESQNNVKLALLDLAQSLELERAGENFDVLEPESGDAIERYMGSIIPPDQVYDHAVTFKPQIKEQQYLLESQKISYAKFDSDYVSRYKEDKTSFEDVLKDVEALFGLKPQGEEGDKLVLTDYELEQLRAAYEKSVNGTAASQYEQEEYVLYGTYEPLSVTLTHIINNKSGISFTSYSHTGLPVAVLAHGVNAEVFNGYYDNTQIYHKLAGMLGIA